MIDQNSQFFAILTKVGEAKQANADALGIPWPLTHMGVGDANGTDPIPDRLQIRLINERRRAPLNQLKIDPVNPAVIITEQVIPADVGGFWIREIGLYDADGDLVAVANCAPSFKPVLSQGSGRTQIVRMNFIVSSTGNIVLKIDPAVVLATRESVDLAIKAALPDDKSPGTYRQVTIDKRGIVQSGGNPTTLAGYGIDIPTQEEAEAQSGQDNTKPMSALRVFQAIVKKLGLASQSSVTDVTPGKLMKVGAGGLMSTVEPFQDANDIPFRTGFFGAAGLNILNGPPQATSGDMVVQMVYNVNAAVQQWYCYSSDLKYFRRRSVGVWSAWKEDLHAGNVATDDQVDTGANDTAPVTSKKLATRLGKLLIQATESAFGWLKIATQPQVNAGTDDATAVTPKKLRMGFVLSLTTNGYLILPSWMGSFIVQWTTSAAIAPGGTGSVSWPIAFPANCVWASGSPLGNGANGNAGNVVAGIPTLTSVPLYNWGAINSPARVFSFGV